ncbi:hypothetical protein TRVL_04370 [Trypanosoma vivax]|nr:hypothetical protein TRVL_04370 [Trypanosoma vivax]
MVPFRARPLLPSSCAACHTVGCHGSLSILFLRVRLVRCLCGLSFIRGAAAALPPQNEEVDACRLRVGARAQVLAFCFRVYATSEFLIRPLLEMAILVQFANFIALSQSITSLERMSSVWKRVFPSNYKQSTIKQKCSCSVKLFLQ